MNKFLFVALLLIGLDANAQSYGGDLMLYGNGEAGNKYDESYLKIFGKEEAENPGDIQFIAKDKAILTIKSDGSIEVDGPSKAIDAMRVLSEMQFRCMDGKIQMVPK